MVTNRVSTPCKYLYLISYGNGTGDAVPEAFNEGDDAFKPASRIAARRFGDPLLVHAVFPAPARPSPLGTTKALESFPRLKKRASTESQNVQPQNVPRSSTQKSRFQTSSSDRGRAGRGASGYRVGRKHEAPRPLGTPAPLRPPPTKSLASKVSQAGGNLMSERLAS
jgi:hypothetical protein